MNEGQRQLFNLGRFVLAFAQVEAFLRLTLAEYGRVPETVAKVALAGVRTEDAISYLRKLFKADSLDTKMLAAYEDAFSHLEPIKEARNLILHHGIDWLGHGFATTNRAKILNPNDAKVIPISADILEQMLDDLEKVTAILINNLLQLDGTSPSALAFDPAARKAWRYRPQLRGGQSAQEGRNDQPQDKKRGRCRQSSPP
ncbi:MAG: hypothetical protein ACYCT1_13635 [Steroidobacteraceae bacterium]